MLVGRGIVQAMGAFVWFDLLLCFNLHECTQHNVLTVLATFLLPYSKWYSLQAFRAVNQALGRCIRHLKDYGALFLIDARYSDKTASLARWLSKSFKVYSSFGFMNQKLKEFYKQVPEELVEAGKWGVAEVAQVAEAEEVIKQWQVRQRQSAGAVPLPRGVSKLNK